MTLHIDKIDVDYNAKTVTLNDGAIILSWEKDADAPEAHVNATSKASRITLVLSPAEMTVSVVNPNAPKQIEAAKTGNPRCTSTPQPEPKKDYATYYVGARAI